MQTTGDDDPVPVEAQAPGAPDLPRLLWLGLVFLALTALGVWVVYAQYGDHSLEWDPRLLDGPLAGRILGLLLVYYLADGLRLWFCLRALGQRIPLGDLWRLVFLNLFVSNVTPMATGGGVAQVWFMQRHGVPIGTAMTATTIRTLLAVIFIFGATPPLIMLMPAGAGVAGRGPLLELLAIAAAAYVLFFAILMLRTTWITRVLLSGLGVTRQARLIQGPSHRRWRRHLVREMGRFSAGFREFRRGGPRYVTAAVVSTMVFLLALFSFPAVLFEALGHDSNYWTVIGRMAVTTLIMYFAPTPGAAGIAEGAFGTVFADMVTASHLVLVTVLWRVLTVHLGMVIGIVATQRELVRATDPRGVPT